MSKPLLSIRVNQIYIRLLYQNSKNYGNHYCPVKAGKSVFEIVET